MPAVRPADNPDIYSGGNFHRQPVAIAMDTLGIAMAEYANESERRIERLVNPQLSGLPAFLTPVGGINDGFIPGIAEGVTCRQKWPWQR